MVKKAERSGSRAPTSAGSAKRPERFSIRVYCLTCANKGDVVLEQTVCDEPYGRPKRNILFVPEGFRCQLGASGAGDRGIFCNRCGSEVAL
jgi:hypothetical protein